MLRVRRKLKAAHGRGYTLLEVILSLAILGGSMVVVGRGFFRVGKDRGNRHGRVDIFGRSRTGIGARFDCRACDR